MKLTTFWNVKGIRLCVEGDFSLTKKQNLLFSSLELQIFTHELSDVSNLDS